MTITPPDAKAHLAAIVASADDAIVSKDLSGVITADGLGAAYESARGPRAPCRCTRELLNDVLDA